VAEKVIVYLQDNGVIAIVRPTAEAIEMFGIMAIALKDVPAGKKFKIIDESDLPADRSQRAAWTVDEADLTDGVGAVGNDFPPPGKKK
jgi:hypothetical protein